MSSTTWIIGYVPAAARAAAEAAIAPYLLSPNAAGVYTFSVPLSPTGLAGDTPTAYGCCAPADDRTGLLSALPGLIAAFPGSAYTLVPVGSYSYATSYLAWLAAQGLIPIPQVAVV